MATEIQQVRAELANARYSGLTVPAIVDLMNAPRQTGTSTTYREVTIAEVYDAISPGSAAKLQEASGDYAAASNDAGRAAAADAAALYGRLADVGAVAVETGTPGRSALDGASANGYITAAELAAIVALGTVQTPILQTCWQAWGWDHSTTLAQVKEAMA